MRIVAGAFGGRRLRGLPAGPQTRPSSDRLRAGLFSALQARGLIAGARVLDLFAGSGALGLEALSRGAEAVIAVDSRPQAAQCIAHNARSLGVSAQIRVVRLDLSKASSLAALAALPQAPFDLVLCDPPYARAELAVWVLAELVARGALRNDAVAAVEHADAAEPTPPDAFLPLSRYRYGGSAVSLWRRNPS